MQQCTHDYHHITQSIQDLSDSTQQNNLHSIEENASSFANDADTLCDFSIVDHNSDTENTNDTHMHFVPKHPGIHSQRKHAYRNTFGDSHIQYHDFEGCDISQNTLYSHHVDLAKDSDEFEKLHYIYQHFEDSEKLHQIEPESEPIATDDDSLYLYVNNDIEYGLFEDIVDSYYLDSQIKDNFQCDYAHMTIII